MHYTFIILKVGHIAQASVMKMHIPSADDLFDHESVLRT